MRDHNTIDGLNTGIIVYIFIICEKRVKIILFAIECIQSCTKNYIYSNN